MYAVYTYVSCNNICMRRNTLCRIWLVFGNLLHLFMKSGDDSILSLNIWSLPQNFRYFLFLFCLSLKKVFKNISYVKLSCRFYLSVCTWKHVNSIKILHITNKKLNMLDIGQNQFQRLAIPLNDSRMMCI